MNLTTISQADLTNKTQEVVDRVQRGEVIVVECSGQKQIVLLDPLDFRLLQALAQCAIYGKERKREPEDQGVQALQAYLADEISLGKAAELLNLSRFELQARFLRLGVPLRIGSGTLDESRAEIEAARSFPIPKPRVSKLNNKGLDRGIEDT
jgi:predicted HTH domain antitoxin